ncbi:nuclease-related domain-containing protein [Anaerotruncus colihominis]|jgi:hypothetical protein|nr:MULTISPECIES: nuclease-related domain-containing protein [Anaerotruncus]MCI8493174.1 NERD domain-containing protein [Anaerotruncus sp.]MCR2025659.1 NERD domain-containing protein [Anaerotruncus colihominis]
MHFYFLSLCLCVILLISLVGFFIVLYVRFSGYLQATGYSFFSVLLNTGRYGEALLFSMLDSRKSQKYIIPNVYLNTYSGALTEIDLILITSKGLFIFESKNYSGKIYGSEHKLYWDVYYGRKKYQIYNPVLQNRTHVNALIHNFPMLRTKNVYSFVVFGNGSVLKVTSNEIVIHRKMLSSVLDRLGQSLPDVFDLDEMALLFATLKLCSNPEHSVKKRHIEYVSSLKKKHSQ